MDEFIAKIDKLDNEELARYLLELYLINPEEAATQFRIEIARKIMKDDKSLFERLSKL